MAKKITGGEINLAEWIPEFMNRTKQTEIRLGEIERQLGHIGITYRKTELDAALNQLILERKIELQCRHGLADSYVVTLVQSGNPRQLAPGHQAMFCRDQ